MAVAATTTTIVTAAGAGTWKLLRHIVVANESSAAILVSIGIDTAGTNDDGEHLFKNASIEAGDSLVWDGFLPLLGHASAPHKLYAICSDASAATITVGMVTGP
jgi:hypothetical protein